MGHSEPEPPKVQKDAQSVDDGLGPGTDEWVPYTADPNLRNPPSPGSPGNKPPGEDLDLNIGWERFEKLMLAVARHGLGLRGVKFRRYGVRGQEQHGIDLAGREPDGRYTVIQCKDYQTFSTRVLRVAVQKFTHGHRPFAAYRLIVATSASTDPTQFADELAELQNKNLDLDLELWGSEQINEHLRYRADIVAQFWTRETAEVFCTGAPLPGVPAPPPDRQEQAERILIGPLRTEDVAPILREADAKRSEAPAGAAELYGDLAARLTEAGFRGHAVALRRRQLDALEKAGLADDAAELAAHLAARALHHGDRHDPRTLANLLDKLAWAAASAETERAATTQRHAKLIGAAVSDVFRPLGMPDDLRDALLAESSGEPKYRPLLVLLLVEDLLATEGHRLEGLDDLIQSAFAEASEHPIAGAEDVAVRLRLVRSEYDADERRALLQEARQHRISDRYAALISAREARRCCLEGRAEEALEYWRDAVQDAIHAGLTDNAADWLYAIRYLNVQYGPWTELDDEHHLAQALRATGAGQLLERVRDPREQAMSALARNKPIEATLSARRCLIDSVVTGNWADENEVVDLLGDLYRDNREPALAASYYQRAGKAKKLAELADSVGDRLLPVGPLTDTQWWVLHARTTLIAAQADLLSDDSTTRLLTELTDLAERGRAGELTESPMRQPTLQATKSACALASRGTPEQAIALLDLLALDVPREFNHYRQTDDEHSSACVDIALSHPTVAVAALTRLFDLAEQSANKALQLVASDEVLDFLRPGHSDGSSVDVSAAQEGLNDDERAALRTRAIKLADGGHYLADVVRFKLEPDHPAVRTRAERGRDRILGRPGADPRQAGVGTMLVTDSYLAAVLSTDDQRACLEKLLSVARDPHEVALNRRDALTAACNLVIDQPDEVRRATFVASRSFVLGEQHGSTLDEYTGEPHPLSSFKLNLGSTSLCGHGVRLAAASATTPDEQEWVRDQAVTLLRSADISDVQAAAIAINRLPPEITTSVDANLLATHSHVAVRQLSAVLCIQQPDRYGATALRLASDNDFRVRRTLADAAADVGPESAASTKAVLETLSHDPRHSVRAMASR